MTVRSWIPRNEVPLWLSHGTSLPDLMENSFKNGIPSTSMFWTGHLSLSKDGFNQIGDRGYASLGYFFKKVSNRWNKLGLTRIHGEGEINDREAFQNWMHFLTVTLSSRVTISWLGLDQALVSLAWLLHLFFFACLQDALWSWWSMLSPHWAALQNFNLLILWGPS